MCIRDRKKKARKKSSKKQPDDTEFHPDRVPEVTTHHGGSLIPPNEPDMSLTPVEARSLLHGETVKVVVTHADGKVKDGTLFKNVLPQLDQKAVMKQASKGVLVRRTAPGSCAMWTMRNSKRKYSDTLPIGEEFMTGTVISKAVSEKDAEGRLTGNIIIGNMKPLPDPTLTHCTVCGDSNELCTCLLYTSPSPRDATLSRMPSSA